MSPEDRRVLGLVALLAGGGVMHFAVPGGYSKIVPPSLGDARRIVHVSGVAELVCAGLLAAPATRRLGGLLSAGLFVGVFPANIYAVKVAAPSRPAQAAMLARLPLQLPMIRSAMKVAQGR
jgi:uncharacterized membrane protein